MTEDTAARIVGRQRPAPKVAAFDVRNLVMSSDSLVQERVVGTEQVERAAVLANDTPEEQLRLALEAFTQRIVEVGKDALNGNRRAQVA